MRRCLVPWIVLLAALTAAFAADSPPRRWVPLAAEGSGSEASVAREAEAPDAVVARLRVPGVWISTAGSPTGPRARIDAPGAAVTAERGRPFLPVLRFLVEVPPGARVTASLEATTSRTLTLAELELPDAVLPVQPPVPKLPGAEKEVPFVEDAALYATDADFPARPVEVVGFAELRGRHVALVEARPIRYNPVRGTLTVTSDARVTVRIEGGDPLAAARERRRTHSPALDRGIDALLLNPAPAAPDKDGARASAGGAAEGAEGLLVVVHDSLADAIAPLVEWKRQSGYKVEVIRTSALGAPATDTAVKSAIQSRYDSWSNPSLGFVLLVGDTDFCPIHTGSGGGNSQVTDNWYACVAGTDYLPELAIARISTRSAAETQAVVDKLMTYEKATFAADAWTKTSGFIGTSDSGHIGLIEGTHDYCIDNYMIPNAYLQTAWSHGKAASDRHYYTYDADTSEIAASINEGRSIVNYSGHGSTTSWQGPTSHGGYDQDDVRNNTNAGMYPFVISNACITGSLALTECFGETWQKVANRGAIAFWGASNNSYWDEDDYLQRRLYANIYPMDSTPALGVIVNETKLDLYTHYGNTGTVAYYFDMYNLLAEPTLSVWTRRPRTLTVTYPSAVPIGQGSFDVTVTRAGTPVTGALVALRRAEDGVFESGYTDETGKVDFTLDPPPTSVGPMAITVTNHDDRPHEGASDVISPDGPWLLHRGHLVDDAAGGDGDGSANPGETIVLPVTVENVGEEPGSGLSGTLSTTTADWTSVLDPAASFPDLAPHALGTSLPDHFAVTVSPAAPDGALLGFALAWSASDGSSGVTSFAELVRAVDFAYRAHAVDDTGAGNGNGVAGPGETVEMTVTIANVGHRDARTIRGTLTTLSPDITLLADAADFPNLPAGAEGPGLPPPFRFSVSPQAPDRQPVAFQLALTEEGSGYSEVVSFEVMISSCATIDSSDVPKAIGDNSSVESSLSYANAIRIEDANVFVDVAHSYIGDLKLTLISPVGTAVVLHNRSGGSTDNLRTWYDTETQPAEPLSKLVEEDSAGTWKLRVEDLAGGDTGSLDGWRLEICGPAFEPIPRLVALAHEVDDAGACDPDGVADVGETAVLRVTVLNNGWGRATGVLASLSSPSRLELPADPVPLPDLPVGQSAVAEFALRVGAVECAETASFALGLTANEGSWGDAFTETLEADISDGSSSEDLEHGGSEPAGWTHQAQQGTDDWRVVSTNNHTPGGAWSWFSSNVSSTKDDLLVSPPYDLGTAGSTLEFWHFVDVETNYDGAVAEISTDGGANWQDLGPYFTAGGYDATLNSANPIGGRPGWTGTYTEWKRTAADLSAFDGRTIRLRFRLTSDSSASRTGWWVDDLVVSTRDVACDAHACGVPGEARGVLVTRVGASSVVTWSPDVLATSYRIHRSSDPSYAAAFGDVTGEDPDPTDTTFSDGSPGPFACWLVTEVGPDGDGPMGHFGM